MVSFLAKARNASAESFRTFLVILAIITSNCISLGIKNPSSVADSNVAILNSTRSDT